MTQAPSDPGALLEQDGARCAATDEAFIRSLQEQHGSAILTYAMRLTGERALAEDIVQETWLRAWRNAANLTSRRGSVRGWLLTVIRNLVIDHARACRARPAEVSEHCAPPPGQEDHSQRVVDFLTLQQALQRLPTSQREVLEHVYVRGLSISETAAVMGIAPGTVKSRSHHALRALRQHVLPTCAA